MFYFSVLPGSQLCLTRPPAAPLISAQQQEVGPQHPDLAGRDGGRHPPGAGGHQAAPLLLPVGPAGAEGLLPLPRHRRHPLQPVCRHPGPRYGPQEPG